MHIDDHEKVWIVERYIAQMLERIQMPVTPENGGWLQKMFALDCTARKICEIIDLDGEKDE